MTKTSESLKVIALKTNRSWCKLVRNFSQFSFLFRLKTFPSCKSIVISFHLKKEKKKTKNSIFVVDRYQNLSKYFPHAKISSILRKTIFSVYKSFQFDNLIKLKEIYEVKNFMNITMIDVECKAFLYGIYSHIIIKYLPEVKKT